MKLFDLSKNNNPQKVKLSLELLGINEEQDQEIILDEITKYVFDTSQKPEKEKTFDLNADYKYYFVDFLKLGINLNKQDIDWWEFDSILESLFLNENSNLSKMLSYRLYEKPSNNAKTNEVKEHRFRMEMKRKYALKQDNNKKINDSLERLWDYTIKKAGENK